MTVEQSYECREDHLTLKGRIDEICCLLFGCPEKPNYIPIATKVKIMFSILIFLATSSLGVLAGVVTLSLKVGAQLNEIQNMSMALDNHIEHSEAELLDHEKRLIIMENKLVKAGRNEKNNYTLDGGSL